MPTKKSTLNTPRKRVSRAKGQVVLLRGRDRYGVQVGAAKKGTVRVALPMSAEGDYSKRVYYLHLRECEVKVVASQAKGRKLLPLGFYQALPAKGRK